MNIKNVYYILGKLLGIQAVILMIPFLVSLYYKENAALGFLMTSGILAVCCFLLVRKKPEKLDIYAKEGFVIVALTWFAWSAFGALPFFLSGSIPSYVDALFETVSGFTTTGSTILAEIESLPKGILFWRSFTHWLGGMGVLVFVMAIVPLSDGRSIHLMRAEMPGPVVGKLEPKVKETAKILYGIYIVMTLILVVLLLFGGMNLYDAFVHAFSTAGTGGFSNRNSSIAYYDSAYIDYVISIFMIIFGINFNLFYFIIFKKVLATFKNEELLAYLGIILAAIVAITANISSMYGSVLEALRYAVFQVASVITTTGFVTFDYNQWPEFSKTVLLFIMFVGACAGSTGGGIKVSRLLIIFKVIRKKIKQFIQPRLVQNIKMDGHAVSDETISGIFVYMVSYIVIMCVSVLLVSLDNFDFATNFSGVLTMMSNVGPGISLVGPVDNFSFFSPFSKLIFSADMLLGRLEIIPIFVLFSGSLWKRRI